MKYVRLSKNGRGLFTVLLLTCAFHYVLRYFWPNNLFAVQELLASWSSPPPSHLFWFWFHTIRSCFTTLCLVRTHQLILLNYMSEEKWPHVVLPMFRSGNFFHYAHNFIEWCHPHPSGKGQLCLGTAVDCCHQPCRHFAHPISDAGTARYPEPRCYCFQLLSHVLWSHHLSLASGTNVRVKCIVWNDRKKQLRFRKTKFLDPYLTFLTT